MKKQVDWIDGSDRQFSVADCVVRAIRKEENALEFIFEEGIWVKVDSNFERTHQSTVVFGIDPDDILCYTMKKRMIGNGYIRKYVDFLKFLKEMEKKSYQLEVTGMYTEYKRALIRCNVMKERRQTGLKLEIDMENIDGFEIRSVFE